MKYFSNFKNDYKKKSKVRALIFILLIIVIFCLLISSVKRKNSKQCLSLRESINPKIYEYLESNNMLPSYNGDSVTIDLQKVKKVIFKKKICEGKVTATMYDGKITYFYDLSTCDICTTKKLSKLSNKYKSNINQKITPYYNYRTVTFYKSKWSDWIASADLAESDEIDVALPKDITKLPNIPQDAIIVKYNIETKNKYRHRDKKWKWYKNNVVYSDFSSEPPEGFSNYDKDTLRNTEYSEWTLNYPEVKSYRTIKSSTAYKWYTGSKKDKKYFNGGEYLVSSPGDEYKRDEAYTATMYSYSDKQWKWYNDTSRKYSSYSSIIPNTYNYRDDDFMLYTNWSMWNDNSSLNNDNSAYREEEIDVYTRYLIDYKVPSLNILEKSLTKEEFEKKLGKSLEEIVKDENYDLVVTYKFENEK